MPPSNSPYKTTIAEVRKHLRATDDPLRRRWLRSIELRLRGATPIRAAKFARVSSRTFAGWTQLIALESLAALMLRWDRLQRHLQPFQKGRPKRRGKPLNISLADIRKRLEKTRDRRIRRQLRSIKLILLGATVRRAHRVSGVGESTFEAWLRIARTRSLAELVKHWRIRRTYFSLR